MSARSQIENLPQIKAIPTAYSGVNFRSRLEARWAAFFDLANWHWTYEPIDFDGWAPDFSLKCSKGPIYVEVKPVDIEPQDYSQFEKVEPHIKSHIVMLCGVIPHAASHHYNNPGKIITPDWRDQEAVEYEMQCGSLRAMWDDAGNAVQWAPAARATRDWRPARSNQNWRGV